MLKTLIAGVAAATMAVTAAAQSQDAKTTKEMQDEVNAGNTGPAMAKGSAAAAADENAPKALPTTRDKQRAVSAATAAGSKNP
jgi:hypothetical protein